MNPLLVEVEKALEKRMKKQALTTVDQISTAQQAVPAGIPQGAPTPLQGAPTMMPQGAAPMPPDMGATSGVPQGNIVPGAALGIDPQTLMSLQQMGIADAQGNVDMVALQQFMAGGAAAGGAAAAGSMPPEAGATGPMPSEAAPVEAGETPDISTVPIEQLPQSLQMLYQLITRAIKEVMPKQRGGKDTSELSKRIDKIEEALAALGVPVNPIKPELGAPGSAAETEAMLADQSGIPAMLSGSINSALQNIAKQSSVKKPSLQSIIRKFK